MCSDALQLKEKLCDTETPQQSCRLAQDFPPTNLTDSLGPPHLS